MCVSPQALLDAMVARLERDGVEPSAKDIAAVIGSGCKEQEVMAALERARRRRVTSAR